MPERILEKTAGFSVDAELASGADTQAVFERMSALQALNAKLIIRRDERGVYQEMVQAAARVIECEYCAIFLWDEELQTLTARACVGHDPELVGRVIDPENDPGIQSQAFSEEYLVHVIDLDDLPADVRLDPGLRCEVDVPIQGDLRPLGVFHFGSSSPGSFAAHHLQLCSLVVDQMAQSLANVRLLEELTVSRDAVIRGMAMMAESRDPHIGGHLERICRYSELLSDRLSHNPQFSHEVDEDFVATISRSAALHDIGKVSIPDNILLKPGRLTVEEFEVMKTHADRGEELLRQLMTSHRSNRMLDMGARVALSHHEHWSGKGYPSGVRSRDIPLCARIVGICDVYDALTSRRTYKEPWSHEKALRHVLQLSGQQFDPYLVQLFHELEPDVIQVRQRFPDLD